MIENKGLVLALDFVCYGSQRKHEKAISCASEVEPKVAIAHPNKQLEKQMSVNKKKNTN